jgi:hypothetical protein
MPSAANIGRRLLPLLVAGLFLALPACNRSDRDRVPLARVGNNYLYLDEVSHVIPEGAMSTDSLFAIRSYVDNWIRQQVLLRHAEENLRDRKPDFERQLRDYYNALLIYAFEEEYVQQNLDTVVTEQQIRTYYQENQEDFILKENIVKVLYVRLFRNEGALANIRRLMQSDKQSDRMRLAELCRQHAVNYFLDDEAWLFFNDLLKEIPIVTYNQEAYLNNNRFVEIHDSSYHYLIRISDFRVTDSYSPVSLEEERIRSTIINRRKAEIIRRMTKELYDRAAQKNTFETYF